MKRDNNDECLCNRFQFKANQILSLVLVGILTLGVTFSAVFLGGCSYNSSGLISEQYEYDQEGRLKCKIAPNGQKTKYIYNDQGYLAKIIYPDAAVRFGYDPNGNRIWMHDGTGRTEYKYDAFDRLIEVVFKHRPEKKIIYGYDPWGRISNLKILAGGRVEYEVNYEYDLLGNLRSIDDGHGRIEYIYYPAQGKIVRLLPNGIKTTFIYSALGDLTSLTHNDSSGKVIASYRYEYNPPGKVARVIEETQDGYRVTRYDWDSRGYLKALHLPDGNTIRYEYDAMGNRVLEEGPHGTIRYHYDAFGRLIQAGNTRYEWDRNGNMIAQIEGRSKTRIRYDGRGLPTLIKTPEATIRYAWDGDGNIISRRHGKEITYYLPNPLAPPGFTLAEFNRTSRLTTGYLYGDSLLGQRDINKQRQYFLEDGFNSIRHIVDMKGRIIGERDYTPFAKPITMKGNVDVNFRMAGERFLPEIKSYVIGGRLYEPKLGRYLTPDPLPGYMERFDSFNKYAHGCNVPGIFMEPRCNQTEFLKGSPFSLPQLPMPDVIEPHPPKLPGPDLLFPPVEPAPIDKWPPSVEPAPIDKWPPPPKPPGPDVIGPQPPEIPGLYKPNPFGGPMSFKKPPPKGPKPGRWPGDKRGPKGPPPPKPTPPEPPIWEPIPGPPWPPDTKPPEWPIPPDKKPQREWPLKIFLPSTKDPFKSVENQLAGIELAATGEFVGILGNITGAVFDPERQCLVLVSDNDLSVPSIKAEDLAVALICVFDEHGDPQFTLDPADPKNPRGKWLKAVYIPEEVIRGTPFGKTLFEADWLLKQYAFGVTIDENGKLQERKSSVAGFKSVADISLEQKGGYGKERWNRFWIVSDEMKLKQAGNSIYFDVAKMGVRSRKIVPDPSSPQGFKDVDTEDDPVATKFANIFTDLYDDIAKESPEFERVRQLAKAVALAKWLKKKNIPVDMDWVVKYVNKRTETTDKITALSIQWEKQQQRPYSKGGLTGIQTITHQLHLFGGVDLTMNPKYLSDDGTAWSLQEAVKSKLREKDTGPVFGVKHNGKTLQATVLPITRSGQKMWKNRRSTEINGITYQVNDQGKVSKGVDRDGNVIKYGYDSDQRLKTVKVLNRNGWRIVGERDRKGSLWMFTNPRGNTLRYKYDSSGYLNEIEVDGHKWATYKYDPKQRELITRYDGYTEKITYDEKGNVRKYEVRREKGISVLRHKAERFIFDYNSSGNLTKIDGPGVPVVNISYTEDGLRPTLITTPQAEIRYSYNPDGRIEKMTHSNGISANYVYDNDRLVRLEVNYQGRRAEYLFSEDGVTQSKDLSGGVAKYGYTNNRLTSVVLDQYGEAKYVYDDQNRLQEMHLSSGNWIEYRYRVRGRKRADLFQSQVITVVTHSSSPVKKAVDQETYKAKGIAQRGQLEDAIEASRILKNSLIVDFFVESKDSVYLNIVDPQNEVHKVDLETARDLRRLINVTIKIRGKLGKTLLKQWENFYNTHLAALAKPTYWVSPDGKEVTLKPILIIKSNEVDYKYANLERVPVLADNFLIFIASKETSVKELATKISNIPMLTKENVVFTIKLPEMSKGMKREWEEAITELEGIVGKENVLFNPSKEEFDRTLRNRDKEVVVIELTHTDKGIILKNNEKYTSKNILEGDDLSHIKYLVAGLGTCNLPRLEKGDFMEALRKKGVGIINASYREVPADIGLKRLRELIRILEDIEKYDLPAYRIFDIIDQLRKIRGQGTTNIGKLDQPEDYMIG